MKTKKNILIVDDNQINLEVISNYLNENDYQLFFALNGRSALQITETHDIDLVLMDIMMPGLDGFETTKLIHDNLKNKEVPIIFVTAKNQTKDIVQGFNTGGVDYITKPFNGEELSIRVKTHIDLADAKKTIIQFQKTRDRLYSVLAHDIRAPLASMALLLDGIQGKYIDSSSPHFNQLISEINHNTKHTLALIHNILDWTKVQGSTIELHPSEIHLKNHIEECMSILNLNLNEKQIQIILEIDPQLTFWGDEMTCSNIFRNILSNAVKFTNINGKVIIRAQERDDQVVIEFSDTGVGMSPEVIEKIFVLDEHYTSKGTNNEKGTGLGLYMVKDFLKLNNGKIEVESKINQGSSFKLYFPKQ
jgi:two-component system sensor histidine kinase/response regulator